MRGRAIGAALALALTALVRPAAAQLACGTSRGGTTNFLKADKQNAGIRQSLQAQVEPAPCAASSLPSTAAPHAVVPAVIA